VQRDAQPDLSGGGFVDAVVEQEVSGRVRPVNLEPQARGAVAVGEPNVVKHRTDVEQLQIWLQAAAPTLQRPEEEHPAGVIEEQVVLGFPDQRGDLSHDRGVGDRDSGEVALVWGSVWIIDVPLSS
jgi:hypothetical protein